ncbi:MAG: DNA replication complex GINS family protein [Desulfurococcus sp.]|nr:DNA replication complex GINS family protein [Desulfurococcus sp.]
MDGLIEAIGPLIGRFVERDFEEEQVKVMFTSQGLTVFLQDGFIELVRGSEIMLPRWIARALVEYGYAKIAEDDIDNRRLSIIDFIESKNKSKPKFEKLKGYFYRRLKEKMNDVIREYRSSDVRDIQKVEIIKTISNFLSSLVDMRTRKILNFLTPRIYPREIVESLSEEEKLFFKGIRALLDVYYNNVLGVEAREPGK